MLDFISGLLGAFIGAFVTILLYFLEQYKKKRNRFTLIYLDLLRMEEYVTKGGNSANIPFNNGWQNLLSEITGLKPEYQQLIYEIYSKGYMQADYERQIDLDESCNFDKKTVDGPFGDLKRIFQSNDYKTMEKVLLKKSILRKNFEKKIF